MTDLTLVVPFALPPAELAVDLVHALQAPHLATLLGRGSGLARGPGQGAELDPGSLGPTLLPHERWLARTALAGKDGDGFARAAMAGFGLDHAGAQWLIVHPAHIEIARTHLLMTDLRRLRLLESHSRALYDSARPYFDEDGHTLLYGDAHTWFMRAGDWADLVTTSPDATAGMNLTDAMPQGARASAYRKLQNEVQMLWHGHAANAEREARGLPAINGFWPWDGAGGPHPQGAPTAFANVPSWMAALGPARHAPFASWLADPARPASLLDGAVVEAALATDWAAWLQLMGRLDDELFGPALAAVRDGLKLRLVLSNRDQVLEWSVSAMGLRSFWRRPGLQRLCPPAA